MKRAGVVASGAVLCLISAVLTSVGASGDLDAQCLSGRPVLAHRPSGTPIGTQPSMTPCLYDTGRRAMEPSLGFTSDGRPLFQAWELSAGLPGGIPPRPVLVRKDGETWTDVSPLGGLAHPTSLDPYMLVDNETGRIFTLDWIAAGNPYCSTISFSDDDARTWTTSPLGCGGFDGESLAVGPPVSSPTIGYPRIVYYCTSASLGSGDPLTTPTCSKSLDGGITFLPTGGFPFPLTGSTEVFPGWTGTPVVDQTGSLYLPKRFQGQPFVALSRDEGATWSRVQVADNGSAGAATRLAVAGNSLAYTWISNDHLPYVATSNDRGLTWGTPVMVALPSLNEAALSRIAAGPDGELAIVYLGTSNAPGGAPYYDYCNPLLSDCDDGRYAGVEWNGFLALIPDPSVPDPVIRTASVNALGSPLLVGGCSADGACKAVLDFLDVQFDQRGEPWGAFVDDCAVARDFQPIFSPQAQRCGDGLGAGVVLRLAK